MADLDSLPQAASTPKHSDSVEKMRQRIGKLRIDNACESEATSAAAQPRSKPPAATGSVNFTRTPHPSNGFLNPSRREPLQTLCRLSSFELSLDVVVVDPEWTGNPTGMKHYNGLARSSSRLSVESSECCSDGTAASTDELTVYENKPSNFTNPLFGVLRAPPSSPAWIVAPTALTQVGRASLPTKEDTDDDEAIFSDENTPPGGM